MVTDEQGTPTSRGALLSHGLSVNVFFISRFCKYFVLIFSVILTLKAVLDAYSFYIARRDIDSELLLKKVSSLEYLNLILQRERALTVSTLEGRCAERAQLTMFRIFNAEDDAIYKVYNELVEKKNGLKKVVDKLGPGLINVNEAKDFIDGVRFDLSKLDEYLTPVSETARNDPKYQQFKDEISVQREKYAAVGVANRSLRDRAEEIIRGNALAEPKYWNMGAIINLATRIDQLRKEREENQKKFGEVEDIVARYNIWIGALTGGVSDNALGRGGPAEGAKLQGFR